MRLQNLSAARIAGMRTVGIRDGRGQIADHAVARILQTHRRVVGPFLGRDSVLEARLLEGRVPVFYTLNQILTPLLGSSGVDVVDDLFLRLYQFTAFVGLFVFRLQTPAGSDGLPFHLVLVVLKLTESRGKVTHTGIERPITHRLLGQQHQ